MTTEQERDLARASGLWGGFHGVAVAGGPRAVVSRITAAWRRQAWDQLEGAGLTPEQRAAASEAIAENRRRDQLRRAQAAAAKRRRVLHMTRTNP